MRRIVNRYADWQMQGRNGDYVISTILVAEFLVLLNTIGLDVAGAAMACSFLCWFLGYTRGFDDGLDDHIRLKD